jgi:tRNA threonylcarbamoyl adenosine modification protein YeaZ
VLVVLLDTATPAVTAALGRVSDGVEILAEEQIVDARAHGELLAPAIETVLGKGGARPADVSAIVAGVGPGPFTGLRVGLMTAAALGQALGVPTYGVCSLDGIGYATTGVTLVATDARRKEIYWAVYDGGVRITEPDVARPADVAIAAATAGVTAAVGDGAVKYQRELALPVLAATRYPQPEALLALAAARIRTRAPGEVLTPLYLRRPDAVEPGARKPVST